MADSLKRVAAGVAGTQIEDREWKRRGSRQSLWTPGLVLATGLAGGLGLWLLTGLVERSHIGGANWSLTGNGALVVPFAGIGVLLGGGWVGLALWFAGARHWLAGGLAVGLLLLALGLALGFASVLFGDVLVPGVLVLTVAAVSGAQLVPPAGRPREEAWRTSALIGGLAIAGFLLAPDVVYALTPLILPLLLALPVAIAVTRKRHGGFLLLGCLALFMGLILGLAVPTMRFGLG